VPFFEDYAVLFGAALLCFWAVFFDGYPIGDDYKNQIIAFEAFREQVNQGELYPRWLHEINHGFGGANLFFYPPLIYYAEYAIDLMLPGEQPTTTILSLSALFFLILSGITCRLWLLSFCSRAGALAGAALYMAAPYHLFIDLYERNNGAEFSVYAFIPLLFLFAQEDGGSRAARAAKFAGFYVLFVLTHMPSAVFVTPFAGLWALLYKAVRHEGRREELLRPLATEGLYFAACVGLGVLIAGLYLYPALTLLGTVRSHVLWSGPFYDYQNWFIWGGRRCPDVFSSFCFQISLLASVAFFLPLFGYFALTRFMDRQHKKLLSALVLLAACCFLLMTPLSLFIWEFFSPLKKIQFPFRFMILGDLFFSAIIGLLLSVKVDLKARSSILFSWAFIFLAFLFLGAHTSLFVQNSPHPDQQFFDFRIKNRILTGEFFPKNPEMTIAIQDFVEKTPETPFSRTEPETIKAELIERAPRRFLFDVTADKPGTLLLRQFYFPGWTAEIIRDGKEPGPPEVRAVEPYGQISVTLPEGRYRLRLSLDALPQERIGGLMSVCGLILLAALCITARVRRTRRPA
jgi:hypothetical protein